jgi:hypothetical protein
LTKVLKKDIFLIKNRRVKRMMQNFTLESFLDPAPPLLSRLFGYRGIRRWVSFYWNGELKGPRFPWHFDGHATGPVNRSAWETFINHRLVLAHNHRREDGYAIKRFEFGSERYAASHWLLLDRQDRRLFAGTEAEVKRFISIVMDQLPDKEARSHSEIVPRDASHSRIEPRKGGALKGIADMVGWLDRRVSMLEESGQWPIFGD